MTGAASGIGKATVERIRERGASIIAVRRGQDVEALAALRIVPFVGGVAKEATAQGAAAAAIKEFGQIDSFLNNAGIIINKQLVDTTLEDWNTILAVNATGAFLFSREAMKVMMPANSGAIVTSTPTLASRPSRRSAPMPHRRARWRSSRVSFRWKPLSTASG